MTNNTTDTEPEVLRRAADLIEEHGWCQESSYVTPNGSTFEYKADWEPGCSMCTLGALQLATDQDVTRLMAEKALMRDVYEDRYGPISLWNDYPDQTAEAVVAQLRATADRLETQDRKS